MAERARELPCLTDPLPESHVIEVGNRSLEACVSGAQDGYPVVLFHGSPGSPAVPRPTDEQLKGAGILLIGYYRPGYGGSSVVGDDYSFKHFAGDFEKVLDYFGAKRASVLGRSGGGPFALACAAWSERVDRAAVLVSPAPPDRLGKDVFRDLGDANTQDYRLEMDSLRAMLAERIKRMHEEGPQVLLDDIIGPDLSPYDRELLEANDEWLRRQVLAGYILGLCLDDQHDQPISEGWYTDSRMIHRSRWDFNPEDIRRPVLVAMASNDPFVPVANGRWLASNIPGAREDMGGQVVYGPDGSHFFASDPSWVLQALLWCKGEPFRQPTD